MTERKFRLRIGHKQDMYFIQEKSLINKRYEIIAIHYNELYAQEDLTYKIKTANKE